MNRTVVLMLVGLGLRLFLIFPGPLESKVEFLTNKADLRNYYWPAQAALRGENPYALWASGQSGEYRADMAPLELMIYVAAVAVWNDPRAIQILFALFDALNIGLLGLVLRASPLKLPFQVFYALGPLTLYNLTLVPEDKTIVLTLTFLIFYLLTLSKDYVLRFTSLRFTRVLLIILAAGLLAGFKWLSVFYLLPLLLHVSPNVRAFVRNGVIFTAVVLLTHLPWIPSWSYVYAFRSARTATPLHIAPAALLNGAGLFNPTVFMVALGAALIGIYALFWFKRIDIFETIVLCMAVGILWTPDMDPVHLSIVVIGFLMVVNWTRGIRPFLVWGLSFWVTAVYAVSTHSGFVRSGWPNLQLVSGEYGSSQMIVLSYALFVAVFAFYVFDKWRARAVGGALIGAELPR